MTTRLTNLMYNGRNGPCNGESFLKVSVLCRIFLRYTREEAELTKTIEFTIRFFDNM